MKAVVEVDVIALSHAQRKRRIEQAIHESSLHVIEEGRAILGYAILTRGFFGRHFVELLVVRLDVRRKGIGERLMMHVESVGLKAGEIWTSTNNSNVPMRRLLGKRQFKTAGKIRGLDDDPEVFYVKKSPTRR